MQLMFQWLKERWIILLYNLRNIVQKRCYFCKKSHRVDQCEMFLAKSEGDKKSFVRSNGLCYGCLRRGHLYANCRRRDPALMRDPHTSGEKTNKDKVEATEACVNATEPKVVSHRTTSSSNSSETSIHTMIIPVVLNHNNNPDLQVITYALLDNQSDACFISEDILTSLQASSQNVSLERTTMLAKQMIDSKIVSGLVVKGLKMLTLIYQVFTAVLISRLINH